MKPLKPNYEIKPVAGCGLGFFTLVPIPEDKKIIEYLGMVLTSEEAEEADGTFLMALYGDYFIDGSHGNNAARYINHSCEPNAKAYRTGPEFGYAAQEPSKRAKKLLMITAKIILEISSNRSAANALSVQGKQKPINNLFHQRIAHKII